MNISGVGKMGVGKTRVGEMGQIIGETGVGEMRVDKTGKSLFVKVNIKIMLHCRFSQIRLLF